nr:proline-, glutamic acid- and leucine-rich protein 1-like isoform X2 [Coffea arabica]
MALVVVAFMLPNMQKLDVFEKLEQKCQGQEINEEEGDEEEEEDENVEEEEEEYSDDGDYNLVFVTIKTVSTHPPPPQFPAWVEGDVGSTVSTANIIDACIWYRCTKTLKIVAEH